MFKKLRQHLFSGPETGVSTNVEPEPAATLSDSEVLACWKRHVTDGRNVEVFRPKNSVAPSQAVLFLHGHGRVMLNENLHFSRLFQDHNLAAVCPDGQRSWWLDVLCEEFDSQRTPQQWLIETIVPFIETELGISCPNIALLGVSMGGQGALHLAYRYSSRFPAVAAISPAVDFFQLYGSGLPLDQMFPDVEAARQASVVLNLQPLAWPRYQFFCCDPSDTEWFDGCARLAMKLSSSGIMYERDLETSGGGHSWDYFNLMAPKAISHILRAAPQ